MPKLLQFLDSLKPPVSEAQEKLEKKALQLAVKTI